MIAKTPPPPYYAVIFTSLRAEDDEEYEKMAVEMLELASKQKGFLGVESARDALGITVSYWSSLMDIQNWKQNTQHLTAQRNGKEKWYQAYKVRIVKVERDYDFRNRNRKKI